MVFNWTFNKFYYLFNKKKMKLKKLKGWKRKLVIWIIIYLLVGAMFYIGESIKEKRVDFKELYIIPLWGFMWLSFLIFIIYCGISQSCTGMGL